MATVDVIIPFYHTRLSFLEQRSRATLLQAAYAYALKHGYILNSFFKLRSH